MWVGDGLTAILNLVCFFHSRRIVWRWNNEIRKSFRERSKLTAHRFLIESRLFYDWFWIEKIILQIYTIPTALSQHSYAILFNSHEMTEKSTKKKNYTEESYSIFILFVQITFVAWRIIRIVLDEKFLNDNNGTKIDLCVRANSTYEYWEGVSKCDRTLNTWSPLFERMYCQRNHLMEITFHRKWPQDRQKLVASSDFQRYAMNASQIDRFHSQIWLRKKIERKKMFV